MVCNPPVKRKKPAHHVLLWTIGLILLFAAIEAIGGLYSGSLALLSDAGHMVTDSLGLGVAAFAAWLSLKPPSTKHSFGMARAEVIGAWLSSLFVILIGVWIIIEAIDRFHNPTPVKGGIVIMVASIGLFVNIFAGWLVHQGEKTFNTRAALLHIVSDLLGSVAALISGTVIFFSGWNLIDPMLSCFIALLIMLSPLQLLRESLLVLMQSVPDEVNIEEVTEEILKTDKVLGLHDLHVWTLSTGRYILTAHIEIKKSQDWKEVLPELRKLLYNKYKFDHLTLQPEVQT